MSLIHLMTLAHLAERNGGGGAWPWPQAITADTRQSVVILIGWQVGKMADTRSHTNFHISKSPRWDLRHHQVPPGGLGPDFLSFKQKRKRNNKVT
jgi:hypothetical protein